MTAKHPDGKNSPEAIRARKLVEAMEFESSAAFARWLGVEPQRWNNFEVGHPFSRDIATRLVRKIPGLSFDWLFTGNPNGLSVELARRLGVELDRQPPTPKARTPRQAIKSKIVAKHSSKIF